MMIFSRGNLQLASEDSWHFACKSMINNQKDKDSTSRRQFCWSSDQPRSLPSLETGCTFALFFSQSIFLPVLILISQQSASNWILFHPSELQTQVKKSSFSWQLFVSLETIFTLNWFNAISFNIIIIFTLTIIIIFILTIIIMAITKSSFDPQSATTPDSVLPAEVETSDFKQDMDLFCSQHRSDDGICFF